MLRTGFNILDVHSAGPLYGRLNLLLADTPFNKTYFIANVVKVMLGSGWLIQYLDLDTFFTAYTRVNLLSLPCSENLRVYNPDFDTLDQHISLVCSTFSKESQLIVLDSISTVYHIFAGRSKPSEVNWRVGLYVAVLLQHIRENGGAILASSLLRSKKIREGMWVSSYPGGMLMNLRSATIYELKNVGEKIEVKVVKHERKSVEGRAWSLPIVF
ncbi:MAG: hypothetical protein QXJ86_02530 [Nitrososphaerales archaeon]